VGGNTLLVWIHRSRVGPYMNALHFMFGLGAFLSPLVIAQAVVWSGGIRWGYWMLAVYVLPLIIWLAREPSPVSEVEQDRTAAIRIHVNWPLVGLIALFMFLYVGAEVGFGGWVYTYALNMGLADETSAFFLTSLFWGALTLGRLLSIPITARLRPRTVLMADM